MWATAVLWLALGASARELDPGACAARFDVQRDKIIRTEESREMGARYLSELDVGARAECRRLCCETDACDVFVYEEKSPGSCYLFNCGPPEDFRCKFTTHGNFSSGVLALSRRLAELQDQERLAERPPPPPPTHSVHRSSTAAAPPPPPPVPITPPAPPAPAPAPLQTTTTYLRSGRCSRYQFECRVGGECIAVYNACDGVPQCADGSDEAPELGCPAAPAPALPPRGPTPPPLPPSSPAPPPIQQVVVQPPPDSGEAYAAPGPAEAPAWPHRLTQAQPPRHYSEVPESNAAPHIFSHAGGLVQEPAFEPGWRRPWPQQRARHDPRPPAQPGAGGTGGEGAWAEWARGWPVPEAEPEPEPEPRPPRPLYRPEEGPAYMGAPKTMPELPGPYSSQQHTLRDSPKKGLGLDKPRAPPPPLQPPPPTPPPPSHEVAHTAEVAPAAAVAVPAAGAAHVGAAHVGAVHVGAADDHDGLSEHPPAAVLLLVLGVCMTGVVLAAALTRARAARRRLRRGKPFAHDADYLVNGMYL